MTLMKYLILILLACLTSLPAAAQEQQRYRVEVLVLMHLEHDEPGDVTTHLTDYSDRLDLRAPIEEPQEVVCPPTEAENTLAAEEPLPAEEGLEQEGLEESEEPPVDPNAVLLVEEMGPEMSDAWRRLRLSGPFRPLQYLSWEQGNQPPFPQVRLRDDEIVYTDDPFADMRLALEAESEAETGMEEEPPADPCDPAAPELDPTAPGPDPDESPNDFGLPEPTDYYRLDGEVSLVRSRFLHLRFDLEWRDRLDTPVPQPARPENQGTQIARGRGTIPAMHLQPEAEFRVHSLEQARQVRSGRMEYFDGPVIAVLAWITPLPLAEPEER